MNTFKNIWTDAKIGVSYKLNTFNNLKGELVMEILICYAVYLTVSVALTVWVARTLHKNGRVFLVEAFRGNTELADSVNHLLVVGFYLINIGYIALALKTEEAINTARAGLEIESGKLGVVLLILGGMHFFNLFFLGRLRAKTRSHDRIARNGDSVPA